MKPIFLLIATVCFYNCGTAQTTTAKEITDLNLGFENILKGQPVGWKIPQSDQYVIVADSLVKYKGQYSVRISSTGDNPTAIGVMTRLPHNYKAANLTLSGYIKTENVQGGRASLFVSVPQVNFDNMPNQKVIGTTNWTRYELSIKLLPAKTKDIFIGGMIEGKGTIWLDDLQVQIDGKPLSEALILTPKSYPAENDTAFREGSDITSLSTDQQTLENLKVLGLIWGYLKFYHPNVAAGKFNWANTLFRILPKVAAAKNGVVRDRILQKFIEEIGPIKKGYNEAPLPKGAVVKMDVDTSWFGESDISEELAEQLREVFKSKTEPDNYYYSFAQSTNVVFPHDDQYPVFKEDDIGLRLLTLYRYWNAIEYFFPYRYLIKDWKKVLTDYIPIMIEADTREKFELALTSLIAKIGDSHGELYGAKQIGKYYGELSPAVGVAYVENKWVVNRYLDSINGPASGVEIGDVLKSIDGRPIDQIVQSRLDITPASNKASKYRKISWALLRSHTDTINLSINRNGRELEVHAKTFDAHSLPTIQFADDKKASFKILNGDIAYVYPGTFKNSQLSEIMRKSAGTKGMVIDLRSYPSDFMVFTMGDSLSSRQVNFARFANIDPARPGRLILDYMVSLGKDNPSNYKGKVVVLVNDYSQSQSEYTAMAFRASGAIIIGSTTAGADGNVSELSLPGSMSTSFSGLGVYYPDGRETQQVGIIPDIECKPTIRGIKEGRDELLERALKYINTGK